MTDQPRPMTMTRLGAISDGAIQPTHDDIATLCDLAAEALGHRAAAPAIEAWVKKAEGLDREAQEALEYAERHLPDSDVNSTLLQMLYSLPELGEAPEGVMP